MGEKTTTTHYLAFVFYNALPIPGIFFCTTNIRGLGEKKGKCAPLKPKLTGGEITAAPTKHSRQHLSRERPVVHGLLLRVGFSRTTTELKLSTRAINGTLTYAHILPRAKIWFDAIKGQRCFFVADFLPSSCWNANMPPFFECKYVEPSQRRSYRSQCQCCIRLPPFTCMRRTYIVFTLMRLPKKTPTFVHSRPTVLIEKGEYTRESRSYDSA